MATLIYPHVGSIVQPRTMPRIAPTPLTHGLVAAFTPFHGKMIECVAGSAPSADTSTPGGGGQGQSSVYTSSGLSTQYSHIPQYAVVGDITMFALFDIASLTNYTPICSKRGGATTYTPYELRVGSSVATDSKLTFIRATTTNYRAYRLVSDVMTTGYSKVLAVTHSGNVEVQPYFHYGTLGATLTKAIGLSYGNSATGAPSDNGATLYLGNRNDGVPKLDGALRCLYIWTRVLADAEIQSLAFNPWQVFGGDMYIWATSGFRPHWALRRSKVIGGGLNVS